MPDLPLNYDACRDRFRQVARRVGADLAAHAIAARGPSGEPLTVDVAHLGSADPSDVLVVLSGVHGVEGFAPSAAQSDFVERLGDVDLPSEVAVLVVHAVNPWGMAHGRRQNESNVDLNRNWNRSATEPVHNDAYDEIHALACPDTPSLPNAGALLADVARLAEAHGVPWVREAITAGQFRHPDGLHFGGDRTEDSNLILERVIDGVVGAHEVLVVDLHTGHGARNATTVLTDAEPGSAEHRFLSSAFSELGTLETTTGPKPGSIARGMAERSGAPVRSGVVVEIGTADDIEQLVATHHEQWVHRLGDLDRPDDHAVHRRYARIFTPDDPEWQRSAVESYGRVLTAALQAVTGRRRRRGRPS